MFVPQQFLSWNLFFIGSLWVDTYPSAVFSHSVPPADIYDVHHISCIYACNYTIYICIHVHYIYIYIICHMYNCLQTLQVRCLKSAVCFWKSFGFPTGPETRHQEVWSHGWQGLGLHSGAVSSWERVLFTEVFSDNCWSIYRVQSLTILIRIVAELADMLRETLWCLA